MPGIDAAGAIGLFMAMALAAAIPVILPRFALPLTVLEIAAGIAIGPEGLNLLHVGPVLSVLSQLGLAVLFLMAGFEVDPEVLRGTPLNRAASGWCLSALVALGLAGLLAAAGIVAAPVLTALALTTTAIGALLPVLKDEGHLAPPYGPLILAAGALGESAPLIMLSLILAGLSGAGPQALILLACAIGSVLAILVAARTSEGRFAHWLAHGMGTSGQLPLRLVLMLMMGLVFLAEHVGIDLVLGAFVAGAIARAATPHALHEDLMARLDGVGSGFLIPIYFVVAGMKLDLPALEEHPHALLLVPLFAAVMLAARGLPALLLYRDLLGRRGRIGLALHSGTQLPLVVAITGIAVERGVMPGEQAAAMVGGGMLSLLVFPSLARWVLRRGA